MSTYLAALVLGLGTGAVYAALGLGLVLTYRASGVVNVAHGAFAMYATYQYAELREVGDIVFPIVGVPPRIHLTDHPSFTLAFTVSLALAGLFGLIAYLLVFRPLRSAPPMTAVVAAVGLMIALQAVAVIQFVSGSSGTDSRFLDPVLTQKPVKVFGTTVPSDRLLLAALAVAAGLVLWAVSRWTRFGLATRAVAADADTVALWGYRTELIAAANWVVAAVLAAAAGILIAPVSALNPTTYSLFVVPALAAALLGGLSSFGATVAGALALGMAQSALLQVQRDVSWLDQPGLRALLPLLLLIGVAVSRGQLVPGRVSAAAATARLPPVSPPIGARRSALTLLVGVAVGVGALFLLQGTYRLGLERSLAGAVVCLSFVVLVGYVGQLSLAQMSIAGVAGFLLARLQRSLHIPFPVAPLLATAVAAAVGLLLGFVARRVRGIDLAVITLAAGVAIQEAVFANPLITGGLAGSKVPAPKVFGLDFGVAGRGFPRVQYGLLSLVVLAACCYGVVRLRGSRFGRQMLAVRANERAASAAGVDVRRTKVLAFGISAGIAGLGGCLIGYGQGTLSFDSFGVTASLFFLAVVAVGGVTTVSGALAAGLLVPGGLLFTALDDVAGLGTYQSLICGLAVVVFAVLRPAGLAYRRPATPAVAGAHRAGRGGARSGGARGGPAPRRPGSWTGPLRRPDPPAGAVPAVPAGEPSAPGDRRPGTGVTGGATPEGDAR
ncbi:ABC transporter permease [Pseudofrankia saprophytica]|uniref:ABC transporter permease n=1 Tax=Pseudofrankia saprophytica TaxID=298655 RepID=UPI000A010F4E|nr:ABC transporter permease [Pseudofrankia saprophytica]